MEHPPYVLVRVHEVALKRGNRRRFVRALTANLRRATAGLGVRSVEADHLVVRLTLEEGADWPTLREALAKTPGAVKFTPTYRAEPAYDDIAAALVGSRPMSSTTSSSPSLTTASVMFTLCDHDRAPRLKLFENPARVLTLSARLT